jgi:regulation of enolase protein 1 (concanavalin A-like superfamily)
MKPLSIALLLLGLLPMFALTVHGADDGKVIFEDKFDGTLAKEWSWLREDAKAWRIGKDGLEIRALPGHGTERKNVLLRPPQPAKGEINVDVLLDNQPTVQFEHAGLQCYFDERNWVGLVKEKLGKAEIVLTQVKDGKPKYAHTAFEPQAVWLRLHVSPTKATAFYRATAKDDWKKVGECDLPGTGEYRLGLAAGGGPKDSENWARFRDFRVLGPAK